MQVTYKNVQEDRIKRLFEEALSGYKPLHHFKIMLHQRKMPQTTMRAQPVLKSLLFKNSQVYKVELSNSANLEQEVVISEVPDDVLKGWFAHELGHVMDYLNRGFFGMLWFGLRYVLSSRFRIRTEHEADKIAIRHGMAEDILKTKRYILEHSSLSEKYKARIRKYYMSADDVMQLFKAEENAELQMDRVEILDPDGQSL